MALCRLSSAMNNLSIIIAMLLKGELSPPSSLTHRSCQEVHNKMAGIPEEIFEDTWASVSVTSTSESRRAPRDYTSADCESTSVPQCKPPRGGNYFDIILVGKTGLGKSTLGNKLLKLESGKESFSVSTAEFLTADDVEEDLRILSVTKHCQLVSNETTMVRVLDTPGLSSTSGASLTTDIFSTNLQVFRDIVFNQLTHDMVVKRLLYFLPARGIPNKADGVLQEELRVMYHYFGAAVLDYMVLIVTEHKEYQQQFELTEKDCHTTKMVFRAAISSVTEGECTASPPVVYISMNDSEETSIDKIKNAPILAGSSGGILLSFQDDVCARCGCQVRFNENLSGIRTPVGVLREDKNLDKYDESNCHPRFVRKYSTLEKVFGGVKHVVTFGVFYFYATLMKKKTWPGFTNSEEICSNCNRGPGSPPCHQVLKEYKGVSVTHSNKLDQN